MTGPNTDPTPNNPEKDPGVVVSTSTLDKTEQFLRIVTNPRMWIGVGVVVGLCWIGYNYVQDLRERDAARKAEIDTLKGEFKQIGEAFTTQNKLFQSAQEKNNEAIKALGQDMVNTMRQQGAQLQSLYQAVGTINQTIATLKVGADQNNKRTEDGSFKGVELEQQRPPRDGKAVPPTAKVTLNYNINDKNLSTALTGSWMNYREDFFPSLGEWKTKEGGYRAAFRLKRKIMKPDPKDPTKLIEVGEEEIPLTSAEAEFDKSKFEADKLSIPRWTLSVGAGSEGPDSTGKRRIKPMVGVDYRFTNTLGLGVGNVGSTTWGALSYRFGGPK